MNVDWAAAFADVTAQRVELPTYAFVQRKFWLPTESVGSAKIGSLGLTEAEHALLGAVVDRPDSGGVVLTGRLSTSAQPWLADHAVAGTVLFPGAGFVELALRAGDEVGCSVIEELTLSAPLAVPTTGVVHIQVVVGAPRSHCRDRFTVGCGVLACCTIRLDVARRRSAECRCARAGHRFVGVAAGGCGRGGRGRRI